MASNRIKEREIVTQRLNENTEAIIAIRETIQQGINQKTELVSHVVKTTGLSKRKIIKVLGEHTGTDEAKGHRWTLVRGDKAAKLYRLLNTDPLSTND